MDNYDKNFTLRLPNDLREKLKVLAEEDDRTLTGLIVKVLRDYVKANYKDPK